MCEKLETAGDGLGRNGRFRALAETLAVQLGRGNWTVFPNKQGRAALVPLFGTVAAGLGALSKDDRRAAGFENHGEIGDVRVLRECDYCGSARAKALMSFNLPALQLCYETCVALACSATMNHWMLTS